MNEHLPFSEPIVMPDGKTFECHYVNYSEGESHPCFMHFHEVGELILFHQVAGQCQLQDQSSQLSGPSLVYLPPMAVHNFELSDEAKSWHLVQFSPMLLNTLNLNQHASTLNAQLLPLQADEYSRLTNLFDWLFDCQNNDVDLSNRVLALLLEYSVKLFSDRPSQTLAANEHRYLKKISPFVQHIQSSKVSHLNLTEAAALCHMSPSYFSRFFKKVFHKTFSEYMLTYRLHLASHHLKDSEQSISDICYELGFSHPSYFIAQFKKYFGLTPKQYRKRL